MPSEPAPPQFTDADLVWIWDVGARRIIWASAAAVGFWGERRLEDLAARRFAADDPNTAALAQLLAAPAPPPADPLDREAEITLLPDGAPVRLLCRGRLRTVGAPERTWLAVHATEPAAPDAPMEASDAAAVARLIAEAETAFAVIDRAGAPRFLNPAAARLFGDSNASAPQASVFDRYRAPERGERAAAAALVAGAFSHTVELAPPDGARLSLDRTHQIAYRRFRDGATGETLLTLEAAPRPSPIWAAAPSPLSLKEDPAQDATAASRIGLALLDAETLTLLEASPAAVAMLGSARARRGAGLEQIAPERIEEIRAAARRLRAGEASTVDLDLHLEAAAGRGPWGLARLSLEAGAGPLRLALALVDLGPERRELLLRAQERTAAGAALHGAGAGLFAVDPEGRIRAADGPLAEMLGLSAAAISGGRTLSDLLEPPDGDALDRLLEARFAGPTTADPSEPARLDVILRPLTGAAPRRAHLALSPPFALGRRRLWIAINLADSPPSARQLERFARMPATGPGPGAGVDPQLAQTASHAFRTALTTIKGFAQLALDDTDAPLPEPQAARIEDVAETATALTELVDRLFAQTAGATAQKAGEEAQPSATLANLTAIAADAAGRAATRHPIWLLEGEAEILAAAAPA
ncbi:MAG: histidine kinase dimerization/phospho-acceptor domain-containing protein, partial [Pseudomonadota bacterium]